jgi:hypothetical protein
MQMPTPDHRQRNRALLVENQRRLCERARAASVLRLLPIAPPGCRGSIEHYWHLIVDLVLPLQSLLSGGLKNVRFRLDDFGVLSGHALRLFPDCLEIGPADAATSNLPVAGLMGMNPRCMALAPAEISRFREDVRRKLGVQKAGRGDDVVLIERLPPDDYYLRRGRGGGAQRRSIINHAELQAALEKHVRPPWRFSNVQLETLTLAEQVELFGRARLVIGQHGAGLTNALWMRSGTTVLELSHDPEANHFRRLAELRGLQHLAYPITGKHAVVNVEDFLRWFDARPEPDREVAGIESRTEPF